MPHVAVVGSGVHLLFGSSIRDGPCEQFSLQGAILTCAKKHYMISWGPPRCQREALSNIQQQSKLKGPHPKGISACGLCRPSCMDTFQSRLSCAVSPPRLLRRLNFHRGAALQLRLPGSNNLTLNPETETLNPA